MKKLLINTPFSRSEMVEAKQALLANAERTGYFEETPFEDVKNPLYPLTVTVGDNGAVVFHSEGKSIGMAVSSKEDGFFSQISEIKEAVKDSTLTWCLTGELGNRLVAEAFDKLALKQAKGEEITDADIEACASVEEVVATVVAAGLEEAEVNERIKYARENGVSDKNLIWALRQLVSPLPEKPVTLYREPQGQLDSFGHPISSGNMERIMSALRLNQPLILDGPKGVAKNVSLETASWLCGYSLLSHTMTNDVTKEDILGCYVTDNTPIKTEKHTGFLGMLSGFEKGFKGLFGKSDWVDDSLNTLSEVFKPKVVFEASSVVQALNMDKVILCFDEMNLAQTGILSGIVNTLADGHSKYLYVAGIGEVPIKNSFRVAATMNGLDLDYDGTQPLNEATDDRFKTIRFSNPTGSVFDILAALGTGADKDSLLLVDNIFQSIRDAYLYGVDGVPGVLSGKAVSMRAARRMLVDLKDGVDEYAAFRDNFLSKLPHEEAEVVYTIVCNKWITPPSNY